MYFVECPSVLIYLNLFDVFLMVGLFCILGKKASSKVAFSQCQSKGIGCSLDLSLVMQLRPFSTLKLLFFFFLSIVYPLEGSHSAQPTFMEVILHHLEGEGSHRLFGIVVCGEFVCSPPFVYLFNHEFISVWTRIFISSLGFWSSNTSLCCSNCFGFGSWTLIHLAPLFLAMPHHFCFKHIFIF